MSENLHDIDDLFRNSLEEHEEIPPEKVWHALDSNLDKTNVIQIKRKYNNLKRLAVALLLLLLGTIVYEIQSKKTGQGETLTNNTESDKIKENSAANKLNNSGGSSTATSSNASNSTKTNNAGRDTLNDAVQGRDQKTSNLAGHNTIAAIKTAEPQNNNTNDVTANDDQTGKFPVKRSSGNKTKMIIKNGRAGEELVTEENKTIKNANDNSGVAAGRHELAALQNSRAEKIIINLQKNNGAVINTKRISPRANLTNTTAKNKNLKNRKPFHFNVTAFYSPQFSFTRLEDDRHDPGPQGPQQGNGREEIKTAEPHERSSSVGVLVDIPVGKKWSVQSGITYLNKMISIEPKKIFAKLDNEGKVKYRFDCSSGYTYISPRSGTTPTVGDSVNAAASANTLQYVGIPVGMNYTFSLGKFNIIPGFGTTAYFLVKQKIETELIQGSSKEKRIINSIEGMKSAYFNAFTGISLEYNLSKRIAASVTPTGNFALSSINKNAAVRSYPNSFALAAGLKIKF